LQDLELDLTQHENYIFIDRDIVIFLILKNHFHLIEEMLLNFVYDLKRSVQAIKRGIDRAIHHLLDLIGGFGLLGTLLVVPALYPVLVFIRNGRGLEQFL
jgi:hypothetical protein